jgi:hypothetical protein
MIKFFRHIRQNLIMENKTGKYLKYAIGEIVLVVIGILIALQINNWNEYRKLQIEELKLLMDIKSNLETTLNNLELDSIGNVKDVLLYYKIKNYIDKDIPYSNQLDSAFGRFTFWYSPFITSTAYKSLQSKGLDIIKNETLKNNIVSMYEVESLQLTEDYDRTEWNLSQTAVTPFFSKHIRRLNDTSLFLARPNDFESLKHNDEFLNILSMLIRQRKKGLLIYKETMISMRKLISEIEEELNSRK